MIQPNLAAIVDTSAVEAVTSGQPTQAPAPEGQFQRTLVQEIREGELPEREGAKEDAPVSTEAQIQATAAEIRQRFLARENLGFNSALPTGQYVFDGDEGGVARPVAVPPLIQSLTANNQAGLLAGLSEADLAAVADLDPQQLVAANRLLESLRAQLAARNPQPSDPTALNSGGTLALPELERSEPAVLPEALRALLEQRSNLREATTETQVASAGERSAELLAQAIARRENTNRSNAADRSSVARDLIRAGQEAADSAERDSHSLAPLRVTAPAPEPSLPADSAQALAQVVNQVAARADANVSTAPFGDHFADSLSAVAPPTQEHTGTHPTTASSLGQPAPTPLVTTPENVPTFAELLATRGGGNVRLRLNPPQLGEIDLSVTVRGGVVDVSVVAHEPGAAALVATHKEALGDALAARDLRMNSFEVSAQNRDAGEEQTREEKQGEAHNDSDSRGHSLPGDRHARNASRPSGFGPDIRAAMPPPQHVQRAYAKGGIDVHV